MSEPRKFPAEILFYLLFSVLGLALTAACLAGAAQWMVMQGYSGTAAAPLATASVCIGSLLSALAAAFRKRERGLLTGALQSAALAGLLAILAMFAGTAQEPMLLIRLAAVLLCGGIGGLLGVTLRGRRRALR